MQAHLSWWASTPSTAEMAAPLRVNFSGTLQNSFDENVKKTGRHTWRLPANCAKHFNTSYCLKCWISFFQTFYNICMFPTKLSAKYFCENSPPCCTRLQDRTQWALCRRRGWGGPLIITIYIYVDEYTVNWVENVAWYLTSVEWEVISYPSHVPIEARGELPLSQPVSPRAVKAGGHHDQLGIELLCGKILWIKT